MEMLKEFVSILQLTNCPPIVQRPPSASEATVMDSNSSVEILSTCTPNNQQGEDEQQIMEQEDANSEIQNLLSEDFSTPEMPESEQKHNKELDHIVSELKHLYPDYTKQFLSCKRCASHGVLRPHCKCRENNIVDHECIQLCPDLTKCTKDTRQQSHCPTCLHIGKGISEHKTTISSLIHVYICANCAQFYSSWKLGKFDCKLESLKCKTKLGKCLQDRKFGPVGVRPVYFCTWCRLKLMQLLGFKMNDQLKRVLRHPDPEKRKSLQEQTTENRFEINSQHTITGNNIEANHNHSNTAPSFHIVDSEEFKGSRKRCYQLLPTNNWKNNSLCCLDIDIVPSKRHNVKNRGVGDQDEGQVRAIDCCQKLPNESELVEIQALTENSGELGVLANKNLEQSPNNTASFPCELDDWKRLMQIGKASDDEHGELTPFHEAVLNGQICSVKFMLEREKDVINEKCSKGRTAAILAAFGTKGKNPEKMDDMVNLLENGGADLFDTDRYGFNLFDYKYLNQKIYQKLGRTLELIRNTTDMDTNSFLQKQMESHCTTLDEKKQALINEQLNTFNDRELNNFHFAALNSECTPVLLMIMRGIDLNTRSHFQRTALHFAAMSIQRKKCSARIYQVMIVEKIIDEEIRDYYNFTAADYLRASINKGLPVTFG